MKKYYSLIDKIYNKNNILAAFKLVKKNKGAPGIDGETIQNFESSLEEKINEIHCELKSSSYCPSPVRRTYIDKDDGDYFLLKENGDGLLGEDIEGKIYEGSINTSLYSSSCSGKILAKKGTESVKVTFNINGVGQKTVKATKVSSLDGDTEIWSFSYVVNSYVTSLSSVYVTIDDYLDNNFGKNYIISESYGLES